MKQPLYRKVNSKARGCRHNTGDDASSFRHTKNGMGRRMTSHRRGVDYTPLFKFLLSKVGFRFDDVLRQVRDRVDDMSAVYILVCGKEMVRYGESTYFSGLYVDDDGVLRKVLPELTVEQLTPKCACCTHTFNGVRFTKKFSG